MRPSFVRKAKPLFGFSFYGDERDYVSKALEVVYVNCQKCIDIINEHRSDNICVVDLLSLCRVSLK